MMQAQVIFVCCLAVVSSVAGLKAFLDCPGNKPSWLNFFTRRCCTSELLPKGCECFSVSSRSGYTNTLGYLPKCPKRLDASFLLYAKNNRNRYVKIKAGRHVTNTGSKFQVGKPVKFIIHGFLDHAPRKWNVDMKNAILKQDPNSNVILVDWRKGAEANLFFYASAVANGRMVGAMIAKLVTDMKKRRLLASYNDVHLIGHSIGAHIAGTAGKEVKRLTGKQIGRITGLDPAGPSYSIHGDRVRLGKHDAKFVDVIHTSGLGINKNIGDVDFWPNGGRHQPGCNKAKFIFKNLFGGCSHSIVTDYFTNSIRTCHYSVGSGCRMGYHANSRACRGVHKRLKTSSTAPYCGISGRSRSRVFG